MKVDAMVAPLRIEADEGPVNMPRRYMAPGDELAIVSADGKQDQFLFSVDEPIVINSVSIRNRVVVVTYSATLTEPEDRKDHPGQTALDKLRGLTAAWEGA